MNLRFTLASAALFTIAACSSKSPDSCFAGSTLIATPLGPRPIRDLVVGDEVWSYDAVERRFAIGKVTAIHRARGAIRSVRTAAGVLAAVTDSHPLFVAEKNEFVAAGELTTADQLLHWNGDPECQPATCAVLGFSSPAPGDEVEVFNLTVGDAFSTFFADGFFAHNKSEPCFADVPMSGPAQPFCIGSRGEVTLHPRDPSCVTEADRALIVLATSDPGTVLVEGREAIAVSAGSATITGLYGGSKFGSTTVSVVACAADTGVDGDAPATDTAVADSADTSD